MSVSLDDIRDCLEGAVPTSMATCAPDGTPNVTYVSQVQYVDEAHVALTFQFFNKTRENVLAHPRALVDVIDPATGDEYRLALAYLRTETQGALFEKMKARLAGIASHTGMAGVFRLQGADVYRVLDIERVPGEAAPAPPCRRRLLPGVRACVQRLAAAADLSQLLDAALDGLHAQLDVHHAMVLMVDESGQRLYTVASRGYAQSGVGSEIALGCGVIGVCAQQATPIRIPHMTAEYSYGRAVRDSVERHGGAGGLETAIPLPGLADSRSQLAVPLRAGRRTWGVLYVESPLDARFGWEDEDALVTIGALLGVAVEALRQAGETASVSVQDAGNGNGEPSTAAATVSGAPMTVRHYAVDDSVFIGDDYLIKGVAGAILAKLLREHAQTGRTEFSNRELRLDRTLRLPELADNLEARLLLLQRRLDERGAFVRIERTGRGRFGLRLARPYRVSEQPVAD